MSKSSNCNDCGSDRVMLTEDMNAPKRCADCGKNLPDANDTEQNLKTKAK